MVLATKGHSCGTEQVQSRLQVEENVTETGFSATGADCMDMALVAERDYYKAKCRSLDDRLRAVTGSVTYKTGFRIRGLVYGPIDPILKRLTRSGYLREMAGFPILADELALHPISLDVPTHLACCNPSIVAAAEGWLCTVRTHNSRPVRDGIIYQLDGEDLVNENWLLRLNEDLTIAEQEIITALPNAPGVPAECFQQIAENGLEDLRPFTFDGATHAVASATTFRTRRNTMIFGRLSGPTLSVLAILPSPWGERQEKNWMPFVAGDKVFAVYSVNPFVLLELGKEGIRFAAYRPASPRMPDYRGSSQLLPYEDGCLCVVHRRSIVHGRRYYVHRFIAFNADWSVRATSPEFFIERRGIEFCAGIASKGDRFVLSYGLGDVSARAVELSTRQIQDLLVQH